MTLLLAAGLVWGCATESRAVEFNAAGEWAMGFGGVENTLTQNRNGGNDVFEAQQRLRLQLEAVVSESLSGTFEIEIGDTTWGKGGNEDDGGGALGADGKIISMRSAFIDWIVPSTDLSIRMGMQGLAFPNAAGGSSIMDDQSTAVVASWAINDNVSLTAFWMRPYNDNYSGGGYYTSGEQTNVFDNVDYFGLSVPLSYDGVELNPWLVVGQAGVNSWSAEDGGVGAYWTLPAGFDAGANEADTASAVNWNPTDAYSTQWYVGMPVVLSFFDPLTIEFDINYGYSGSIGRYDMENVRTENIHRADTVRQGWLVKGLLEYAMDWGRPGLFAWYASGDDSDVSNGSERMPSISPSGNFTSFMGDGPNGYSINGGYDLMLSYAGTWGIGLQIADMSFMEKMSHTLRIAYWGGTNSTDMVDYLGSDGWNLGDGDGYYLTTSDGLVEINLDTTIEIYENLVAVAEVGYIINAIDQDLWEKGGKWSDGKADAWKVAVNFMYSF